MSRKAKALEFMDTGYNIQITGRHIEVTDAMQDYALEKISKIERLTDRIIEVNVILDIQKMQHRAEIIVKIGHFKITSRAATTDMYVSIDKAVDKLEAQILRYKSKMQDHHPKEPKSVGMHVNILGPSLEGEEEQVWEDEFVETQPWDRFKPHRVVKQETLSVKTLTYNEAIMKMELVPEQPFLVFKSEEDLKLKVIYRQNDGHYGVIELTY